VLHNLTFRKDWRPNTGPAYVAGEGAAFELDQAVQLVGQGIAAFTNPDDLTANQAAVTSATPTSPVGVNTFLQPATDGSDPVVVLRRPGV
jgi:hypothetical protein